jgi:hypothetical protein
MWVTPELPRLRAYELFFPVHGEAPGVIQVIVEKSMNQEASFA